MKLVLLSILAALALSSCQSPSQAAAAMNAPAAGTTVDPFAQRIMALQRRITQ